jgi:signal peptidase I
MTTEDGARSSEGTPPVVADTKPADTAPTDKPTDTEPTNTEPTDTEPTDTEPTDRATVSSGTPSPAAQPARHRGTSRPAQRPKKKSFFRELPGIVITALVISVLIKTFLVQAFYIPSGSMENTLLVNDRVLVNKLADKPDEIHRGDVVVFRDPGGWLGPSEETARGGVLGGIRKALVFVGLAPAAGEEDLIKRVIAVGGDTVSCCTNGHLTVNGAQLDEPYLFPSDVGTPSASQFGPIKVPAGKLWVMGDHRSVSEDSRAHRDQPGEGFVPVDDVIGRAFTIVWPVNRAKLLHRPATFDQPKLAGPTH